MPIASGRRRWARGRARARAGSAAPEQIHRWSLIVPSVVAAITAMTSLLQGWPFDWKTNTKPSPQHQEQTNQRPISADNDKAPTRGSAASDVEPTSSDSRFCAVVNDQSFLRGVLRCFGSRKQCADNLAAVSTVRFPNGNIKSFNTECKLVTELGCAYLQEWHYSVCYTSKSDCDQYYSDCKVAMASSYVAQPSSDIQLR